MGFAIPIDYRVKIKKKKKQNVRQILGFYLKTERAVKYEGGGDTNNSWCAWKSLLGIGKETGVYENQRKNHDHTDHRIF